MTPDQLTELRIRLSGNRQPVFRGEQYGHPRGWNEALDFVERVRRDVMGEGHEPARSNP